MTEAVVSMCCFVCCRSQECVAVADLLVGAEGHGINAVCGVVVVRVLLVVLWRRSPSKQADQHMPTSGTSTTIKAQRKGGRASKPTLSRWCESGSMMWLARGADNNDKLSERQAERSCE